MRAGKEAQTKSAYLFPHFPFPQLPFFYTFFAIAKASSA